MGQWDIKIVRTRYNKKVKQIKESGGRLKNDDRSEIYDWYEYVMRKKFIFIDVGRLEEIMNFWIKKFEF